MLITRPPVEPPWKSKTEPRFRDEVLIPARRAGLIVDYSAHPMNLRVSEFFVETKPGGKPVTRCARYSPDFAVFELDGTVTLLDTKGSLRVKRSHGAGITEAVKLRMRVAASIWAQVFRLAATAPRPKRDGGGWEVLWLTEPGGFMEGR